MKNENYPEQTFRRVHLGGNHDCRGHHRPAGGHRASQPDAGTGGIASHACLNNLRQIEAAVQQIAIANNLADGDTVVYPSDVAPYIKLNANGSVPPCPAVGTYFLLPVGQNPQSQCSLSAATPAHALK